MPAKGIKYFCGLETYGFDLLEFVEKPSQATRLKVIRASMLHFSVKRQVLTGYALRKHFKSHLRRASKTNINEGDSRLGIIQASRFMT